MKKNITCLLLGKKYYFVKLYLAFDFGIIFFLLLQHASHCQVNSSNCGRCDWSHFEVSRQDFVFFSAGISCRSYHSIPVQPKQLARVEDHQRRVHWVKRQLSRPLQLFKGEKTKTTGKFYLIWEMTHVCIYLNIRGRSLPVAIPHQCGNPDGTGGGTRRLLRPGRPGGRPHVSVRVDPADPAAVGDEQVASGGGGKALELKCFLFKTGI